MNKFQRNTLIAGVGLMMSSVLVSSVMAEVKSVDLNASFFAFNTADFSAKYEGSTTHISDLLKKGDPIGLISTTQPGYAKYRDIKFSDSTGKAGVLTFHNTGAKQIVEVTVDNGSTATRPTVNNTEGSTETMNKTSETWFIKTASEYKQLPVGEYTDTITVSYDNL
ncbi:hypothetical protein AHX68_21405 [Salmonella enterica subsp. enterica serovar Muenchen]|nr:hypothetical protein [Salmonella enterica subsp. enterica serovar Muenchen]EDQ9741533.1 hypothetical protein [Salmonella enterica subsp. enterica serovar Oranienburg]EEO7308512.1 hypothetical protein [Salmonella enterica]ECZ5457789.1 hypothetical protein [Salmonella enterica subsp. enterica serovar Muenchen]EDG8467511.1 hypothetical protein [Salmonella enterica subsp. enterica serovar Muenchen]